MPKLNEYLGSIVSGITDARMMSDIQAVKVAQEYAKHPWLQHFAVPRMRIEDVELTIPIALDSISERSEPTFERVDNESFRTKARDLILKSFGIPELKEDAQKLFDAEIAEKTRRLDEELALTRTLDPVKNFTDSLALFIRERPAVFGVEKLIARRSFDPRKIPDEIGAALSKEIKVVSEKKVLDGLNVVVEADKLREKKPESLVFIKMKLSEEGMEWHKIEAGGRVQHKLLPE